MICTLLKVVFIQRIEILSSTTKSKKIEVKGGFYSEHDMKTELNYSQHMGWLDKCCDEMDVTLVLQLLKKDLLRAIVYLQL